jgi:hypothetical protein
VCVCVYVCIYIYYLYEKGLQLKDRYPQNNKIYPQGNPQGREKIANFPQYRFLQHVQCHTMLFHKIKSKETQTQTNNSLLDKCVLLSCTYIQ